MKITACFPGLIIIAILLSSCNTTNHDNYKTIQGVAWNTLYHISYSSETDYSDSILKIIDEIDCSLSPFNKESTTSRINNNITNVIDHHFATVYSLSKEIHRVSDGAFDPTLAPLIRAWGFGQGHKVSADTLLLDSLLLLTGIEKTEIKGSSIIKENPGIEFNFSALAKGYGVDCIAEMLERNQVENYIIEIGGEIRASGSNPKGKKWAIGIERPDEDNTYSESVLTVYLENISVATSGNYRNFHKDGNKKFGHTISPKSGRPAESDVLSATVIAPSCMLADALATCCMVMGSEEAINLCTRMRTGVMMIKNDNTVEMNPVFKTFLSR